MIQKAWKDLIGEKFRCFNIATDTVNEGIELQPNEAATGDVYPVIGVGERGRGRKYSFVPVVIRDRFIRNQFSENKQVIAEYLQLDKTKSDKQKFIYIEKDKLNELNEDYVLVRFATRIGFRGWNAHYGKYLHGAYEFNWNGKEKLEKTLKEKFDESKVIEIVNFIEMFKFENEREISKKDIEEKFGKEITELIFEIHEKENIFDVSHKFEDWPGIDLCKGTIAQGAAGRMGSGEQLISLIPVDTWFTVRVGGRLYGKSPYYIYKYDSVKGKIIGPYTLEEYINLVLEFEE